MITITAYGGVETIGGNKVLLEDHHAGPPEGTCLFFDFGTDYKVRGLYFEEYLKPRPGAGLRDVLEMGLLPPLEGLYRHDLVPGDECWARLRHQPLHRRLERVDGVLVTHAHLDHSGGLSFLRPDVPVFSSALTGFVAKAIQDSGKASDFETEVCYLTPRVHDGERLRTADPRQALYRQRPFHFPELSAVSGEASDFWTRAWGRRQMDKRPFAVGPTRVGGLSARLFPVDHSIPGACAWAVETSVGWVVYSGDLRLRGPRARQTEAFIQEARRLRPRVLLCEGTRLRPGESESESTSEDDVYRNALREVQAEQGLVVCDFGPRNVDRLNTFYAIAEETERYLVILARDAFLLDAVGLVDPGLPDVSRRPRLRVFYDLKGKRDPWEQRVWRLHKERRVSPQDIASDPGRFMLCFSFWDVDNLIDIAPTSGRYIYSASEAYTEEQMFDIDRLRHWIDHFGMKPLGLPFRDAAGRYPLQHPGLHSSGHASGPELIQMVKEIGPEVLIPIHTEHPALFRDALAGEPIEIHIPEAGRGLQIG